MSNFYMPPMRFHNFVRLFVLPVDLLCTFYFFFRHLIGDEYLVSSPFRYAIYAYIAVKLVQTAVNIITQIGLVTYSGYAFYGVLTYFGLRVVICSLAYLWKIKPVPDQSLPDVVRVALLADIFIVAAFLFSIATMATVILYYFMRKDAFYFHGPRNKKPKPIKERNYPWQYNEKYKPGRKPSLSRGKLRDLKNRRLDAVSGKESAAADVFEADINEGL